MEFDKKQYEDLSLSELNTLIGHLKELYNEMYRRGYVVISVVNGKGNVASAIYKEYGFRAWWEGNRDTCGTTYIAIPNISYTASLERTIKDKYDTVY